MHKYIITRYRKKSQIPNTFIILSTSNSKLKHYTYSYTITDILPSNKNKKNRLIVKVLSLKTETITKTININNKSQLPKFKFIIRAIEFLVNLHYFSDHFITHTDFLLPKTYTIADQ